MYKTTLIHVQNVIALIKESEAHVIILLLTFGFHLLSWSGSSRCSRYRSSNSKLAGISEVLLELISLLKLDISNCGESQQVLETINEGVGYRAHGRILHSE